ncbi:AAA-like domain-containing protein [Ancylothrix sp. C2]|uniref:WD40 domain-containing protein n=1 Tax=Ancylothrix sp. D3o TaxID=2953691 RepID=UPI0021BAD391|nr:AAA-like domain-containing protein [Ancylothrix sp. D3o]MCT7952147.1 AAA-like domain-containing protein [Ancylothrix sp. D3o]
MNLCFWLGVFMGYKFQVGGSLEFQHPSYVSRKADVDLYEGLKGGEFCYVLNSRQMGKSSLRVQMMKLLKAAGIKCASIDLTRLGSFGNASKTYELEWYGGVVSELLRGFGLGRKFDFKSWWYERDGLLPVQRLQAFIEEVLLGEFSGKIVIFIDEIDSIISVPFKDDFFAFIRACYNQRAENSEYLRLSFCLLGVATPADLMADKKRTPFNIGRAIELCGFTFDEANLALSEGLAEKVKNPQKVIKEVLSWTGGQPFLTQKLCQVIQNFNLPENEEISVESFVRNHIIKNWESQDEPEHLRTIRNRLLSNELRAGRLLGLYQQILQKGSVKVQDSPEEMELRLSGLVVKQNSQLKVSNAIYEEVFNQSWVTQQLSALRPYSQAIKAWLDSNRLDISRLLRGEALQEALAWKAGKSLSVEDDDFLAESQRLDRVQIKLELQAERQAKQILEEAKQQAYKMLQQARLGTKIERQGGEALRLFEVEGKEIEALLLAMQAGEDLQKWQIENAESSNYSITSPVQALQNILDAIREKKQLKGHQGAVNCVSFSPQGDYIATASNDGTAILWDLSGKKCVELKNHQGSVPALAFNNTQNLVITGCENGIVRVWDLAGKLLTQFKAHPRRITSLNFSSCGKLIATASEDGTAKVWDENFKLIIEFKKHKGWVTAVMFHPQENIIATGSEDCTVRIWDLSGKELKKIKAADGWLLSICFSPNGEYIATASADLTAKLWDLKGKRKAEFKGHTGWVKSVSFSPDGKYIATGSFDGTARLWDLSGKEIDRFKGHQGTAGSLCFSGNGQYLVTGTGEGIVRVWDIYGKQKVKFQPHCDKILNATFNSFGDKIATACYEGTVKLWDISGQEISSFKAHSGWVSSVKFSQNDSLIATASEDKTAKIWNPNGELLKECKGHTGWVLALSFSPDNNLIATSSADHTARIWNLEGKEQAILKGHQDWVYDVAFSPQPEKIATASADCTAKLWNLSGKIITEFKGHQGLVWSVSFSRNGDLVLTGSEDGTARLWNLEGKQIAIFKGHHGAVLSVSFSPKNDCIATASADGTARLWDLEGREIKQFNGHYGWVWSVVFSPNGEFLLSGSADETARLWEIGKLENNLDALLFRGGLWLGK